MAASDPALVHVHVRRGDTLWSMLASHGVGGAEARSWLAAAEPIYDLRQLQPRHGLTLRFDRATNDLEALHYEIDDRALLVLERTEEGIHATRTGLPYFTEIRGTAGRIEHGLREDAINAGAPPRVVSQLADIFGWELDLDHDLRPGDEFRLVYERTWQAGEKQSEPGTVLGAEIVASHRAVTGIFFEDADGRGGYYRPGGEALGRDFLRYPVEFTEITSEFTSRRRHPLLHLLRPHLGVDFAAPFGTPVRAVAAGVVSFAGWVRELGRTVRIDHEGTLASAYGHLSRIAPVVEPGTTVSQGEVIGYVGASGLATGPHLHFALFRDGQYVDPLAQMAAMQPHIPEQERRHFERVEASVEQQLAALPLGGSSATLSRSDAILRAE
ncbi:MAG TPA: M23 family metallopeptidase [Candidatus Nitrosopolaris sp.]|nr:M23 family metallopeptidase [Candidatus Nitrosopolaris sp.]